MSRIRCFVFVMHRSASPLGSPNTPTTANTLSSSANAVHADNASVFVNGQIVLYTGVIVRPLMPPFSLMSSMNA